ncbi:MAG: hypothetical protein P8126_03595 [Gammaproteobacteria bacterium]|jgi:hypothetical protein
MNTWHEQIIKAINNMELLTIVYDYERRTIEPYVYGCSSENLDILRAYQTSGMHPGWQAYRVDQIESLQETGDTFREPRHDYRHSDPGVEEVYAQLHYEPPEILGFGDD